MKPGGLLRATCRLVLAAYPASWRARYGAELEDVLDQHRVSLSTVLDLVVRAFDAHRHPELGATERVDSGRLRGSFVSLLLAGVVFGLAWVAVLSVRLRSSIGHADDLQNHADISRAISLVQVAGGISLLAILACAALVASATMRRGHRGALARRSVSGSSPPRHLSGSLGGPGPVRRTSLGAVSSCSWPSSPGRLGRRASCG